MNKKFQVIDPKRALCSYKNGIHFGDSNLAMDSGDGKEFTLFMSKS
jgi:hypothetical protein